MLTERYSKARSGAGKIWLVLLLKAGNCLSRLTGPYRFIVAYVIMIISSSFLYSVLDDPVQGDLALYQQAANDLFAGYLPYRDRVFGYPPYALLIFILPRLAGDNYAETFMVLTLVADWLVKLVLVRLAFRSASGPRSLLPLICYSFAVPFIRFFFLQRYDIAPALVCLLAIWFFCASRHMLCGLAIATGAGLKVYPLIFFPVFFVLAARESKGGRFIAGLALGLVPILLLSFILPWWRFAEFQSARGFQVESLYASVLWLGKLLNITQVDWIWAGSWFEIGGTLPSSVLPYAKALFIAAVGISTILASWVASRCHNTSAPQLARILLVPLLGFVALNQVFSPQFMIWLLPLAALGSLQGNPWTILAIPVSTMVIPIFFPSAEYGSGLNLNQTIVLLLRNLALVASWLLLLRELFGIAASGRHVRSSPRKPLIRLG